MEYPRETGPSSHRVVRGGYTILGVLLTGVGIAGVFLPVLPGTIFLILALACFARGNATMEHWLLNHPKFGPTLTEWRANGGIRARTKWLICTIIAISVAVSVAFCPNVVTCWCIAVFGLFGMVYVATRPTLPPRRTS